MAKATWNGELLAERDKSEIVEGNIYFLLETVKREYFTEEDRQYTCPWKGEARYHDIVVGEKINKNAAWSYPEPKEAAKYIKGHVAFERGLWGGGVKVEG